MTQCGLWQRLQQMPDGLDWRGLQVVLSLAGNKKGPQSGPF